MPKIWWTNELRIAGAIEQKPIIYTDKNGRAKSVMFTITQRCKGVAKYNSFCCMSHVESVVNRISTLNKQSIVFLYGTLKETKNIVYIEIIKVEKTKAGKEPLEENRNGKQSDK